MTPSQGRAGSLLPLSAPMESCFPLSREPPDSRAVLAPTPIPRALSERHATPARVSHPIGGDEHGCRLASSVRSCGCGQRRMGRVCRRPRGEGGEQTGTGRGRQPGNRAGRVRALSANGRWRRRCTRSLANTLHDLRRAVAYFTPADAAPKLSATLPPASTSVPPPPAVRSCPFRESKSATAHLLCAAVESAFCARGVCESLRSVSGETESVNRIPPPQQASPTR